MSLKENIDFCIIKKPYEGAVDFIVFLTRRGEKIMDISLLQEAEYSAIEKNMTDLGFFAMQEGLSFEITNKVLGGKYTMKKIKKLLESKGMKYSLILEKGISQEFETLKIEAKVHIQKAMKLYDKESIMLSEAEEFEKLTNLSSNFFPTEYYPSFANRKSINEPPKIGEKVTLNFYLFLQCAFAGAKKAILELNGDFDSKQNSGERNYVRIIESDFKRVESDNPDAIRLECCKNFLAILKEISILHKGEFEYKKTKNNKDGKLIMENKIFKYNMFDILSSLRPETRITLEVNKNVFYDKMIEMSESIKKEKEKTFKIKMSINTIRKELEELSKKLDKKMTSFAEDEEYEKASSFKKSLKYVLGKLDFVKKTDSTNITIAKFYKLFSLPDMKK